MRRALEAAYAGIRSDVGGPFGACIVKDGEVIAVASNRVLQNHDPTAHAEVTAIRLACESLKHHHLEGAHIFSTTEPCPMCFSAIHWAKIDGITYGTNIADVAALGFNELAVSNTTLLELSGSPLSLETDFLRDECLALLNEWSDLNRRTY